MSKPFLVRTFSLKNGAQAILREADPADAKAIVDYTNTIAGESDNLTFGTGEFDMTEAAEAEFLEKCQAAENQIYLLATVEDQIVGSLHFATGRRPRTRHSGEFGLSVSKNYWGQGVGSALLDALIDWARQTGFVKKINLRVRTDNNRAIGLYKRKGFILEGTLSNEMLIQGEYYDLFTMGLNLSN